MIEQLSQAGQVMTAKAPEFEADISGSTEALRKQFAELFAEISRQNGQLSDVMAHFRDFKVSYSWGFSNQWSVCMPLLVLWTLGSAYFHKQLDCLQEETEKLSDWLKQININIKAIKTSLPSSLADKEKSFKAMVDISQRMTDGKHEILFELIALERVPKMEIFK